MFLSCQLQTIILYAETFEDSDSAADTLNLMNSILNKRIATVLFITLFLSFFNMKSVTQASDTDEEVIRVALTSLGIDTIPSDVTKALVQLWPDDIEIKILSSNELRQRLELTLNFWEIVAPEWKEVPASLMIQTRACRDEFLKLQQSTSTTSATSPNKCGDNLRLQLQTQHAKQLTVRLQERITAAGKLPEPSRTFTLQTLTELRERSETRLREMLQLAPKVVDDALKPLGENQTTLNQLQTRLEEQQRLQERETEMNSSTSTSNATKGTINNQQGSTR